MAFICWLMPSERDRLLDAVRDARLVSEHREREALLADVGSGWRDIYLPPLSGQYVGSMTDRIAQDIETLNAQEPLADHSVPLVVWLCNALRRCERANKRQAEAFRNLLEICRNRAQEQRGLATDEEERAFWSGALGFIDRVVPSPGAAGSSAATGEAAVAWVNASSSATAVSVLFDESHGQDAWWVAAPAINKGYARIAEIAQEAARVARLTGGGFSEVDLAGFDALILAMGPQKKTRLADDEIAAIKSFVQAGGGLLVLGAYTGDWHHEANLNDLLVEYGMAFNRDVVMPPNTGEGDCYMQSSQREPDARSALDSMPAEQRGGRAAKASAALVAGVTAVRTVSSCSLYVDRSAATGVLESEPDSGVWEPSIVGVGIHPDHYLPKGKGSAVILAASTTRSKVVVGGSWKMFLDAFIDYPATQNGQLFRNVLTWLVSPMP